MSASGLPSLRQLIDKTEGREDRAITGIISTLEAERANARAQIQERRRDREQNGVWVDGVVYDTSVAAHLRLMTLAVFATRDPSFVASVQTRDGSVTDLTASSIYRVAVAIANHMQSCALWERASLQAIDGATDQAGIEQAETDAEGTLPVGDVSEPSAPDGLQSPTAYTSPQYEDTTCSTVRVTGALTAESDADVRRLYARDRLVTGSIYVDAAARSRTASWVRAGSFWWRRGDRQPTRGFVAFRVSDPTCVPAMAFYEPGRQTAYCAVAGAAGSTTISAAFADTLYTEDDDTFFEVEVYIQNTNAVGNLYLANFNVSTA